VTTDRIADYRRGRKTFGLPASEALSYVRNLRTINDGQELLDWWCVPDSEEPGSLQVILNKSDGFHAPEFLDSLGGVDAHHWIGDHGNLHYDRDDPYLVSIVAELFRDHGAL